MEARAQRVWRAAKRFSASSFKSRRISLLPPSLRAARTKAHHGLRSGAGHATRKRRYAETAAELAMSRFNSGTQEPQLVPAFNRRPMDGRSRQPAAIAASIALLPTPKHAHTVTPVSRRGSAGRAVRTRARSLAARRGLSNSDASHDREST